MLARFFVIAAVAVVSLPAVASADALGLWLTKDRDAKIRVTNCGGSLCGTIAWLAQPIDKETGKPMTDKSNADPARRSRPLIGVRIFRHAAGGAQSLGGSDLQCRRWQDLQRHDRIAWSQLAQDRGLPGPVL